ncbi:MAG TPA: oxalurate catabolism protein HpxZ [Alphaproteobacteria bacterium]
MDINLPEIVAEVTAAFMRYQRAVDTNDADTMNELFWNSSFTVRYGPNGTLRGHAAIAAFRNARSGAGVARTLKDTVITTFGRDFAATNTETRRPGSSAVGRQSQSWVRTPDGWRIAAAHVSDQPGT